MASVLVLGVNGMLGSMFSSVVSSKGYSVTGTQRIAGGPNQISFNAERDDVSHLFHDIKFDYVVNAIGIIKPRINEADRASRMTAITVNSLFPHHLVEACEENGAHLIQIATDCVYSGTTGNYAESAPHDPTDVYGKTKSLGEAASSAALHLRASIIGPEVGRQTSLWEWVRSQPKGARINGFTNHLWNGVTTYHFGRVCAGIISEGARPAGTFHLVPKDIVTKETLVTAIAKASGRSDIEIVPVAAADAIDRTLQTEHAHFNADLWRWAGYAEAPTISEMVRETPL